MPQVQSNDGLSSAGVWRSASPHRITKAKRVSTKKTILEISFFSILVLFLRGFVGLENDTLATAGHAVFPICIGPFLERMPLA